MPSLRQRIFEFAFGPEKQQLQEMAALLAQGYQRGPWELPPEELVRQLKEYDSDIVQSLVLQMGYDYLGSMTGYLANTDAERTRAVSESRRLWQYAGLADWTTKVWTNFGLGEAVQIKCDDPDADEVWREAWTADRNADLFADDCLHELSNWLVVDGNLFLAAFASTVDGKVTFAEIDASEISEIVTDPGNKKKPLFYKRIWVEGTESKKAYYPDWQAYFEGEDTLKKAKLESDAPRADLQAEQSGQKTTVCILHIAHNRKTKGSLWGWPILSMGAPWYREHRNFLQDRLTVARAKAMYVRRARVSGGSRAVAAVRAKLKSGVSSSSAVETNPAAVAGSTLIENQAVETTDLPMSTGAGDAKADHEMFAWMALLSGGLFPTTAGLDTSRWATALAMDKTEAMQWSRYQTFWSAQFKKMVKIVLGYAERFGNRTFENKDAQVSIDSFSLVDFQPVVSAMSQMLPFLNNANLPAPAVVKILQQLWRVAFKALGVTDQDLTSDETFGVAEIPPAVQEVIAKAIQRYAEKKMSADDFAQLLIAELVDHGNS